MSPLLKTSEIARNLPGWGWCVLLALLLAPIHAQAQSSGGGCKPRSPSVEMQAAMYDLTVLLTERLDALPEVDVLIAARSGQDLSRYGLRHSHLAFLLRDGSGAWQAIHLLNRCKSKTSALYREGVVNFIGESAAHANGVRLGIPVRSLRDSIARLLAEPADQARALHQPRYSAVAYPWRTRYQNSNQWILEVTAAAMAQQHDGTVLDRREASTAWLQQQGYVPSRLHLSIGKRLGARFLTKNVAVTDHPGRERVSGNYSVVTVESIFDFLHHQGALEREMTVVLPSPPVPAHDLGLEPTLSPMENLP